MRKAVAILVVFSLAWATQVAARPAVAPVEENAGSALKSPGNEDVPLMEKEGSPPSARRKFPLLPVLIGAAAAAAVALVLILSSPGDEQTIIGKWQVSMKKEPPSPGVSTAYLTCSGAKEGGGMVLHWSIEDYVGTFTVANGSVKMAGQSNVDTTVSLEGSFADAETMTGTWERTIIMGGVPKTSRGSFRAIKSRCSCTEEVARVPFLKDSAGDGPKSIREK